MHRPKKSQRTLLPDEQRFGKKQRMRIANSLSLIPGESRIGRLPRKQGGWLMGWLLDRGGQL